MITVIVVRSHVHARPIDKRSFQDLFPTTTSKFEKSMDTARDEWEAPLTVPASPSIFQMKFPETVWIREKPHAER